MTGNRLKLNNDKAEALLVGSFRRVRVSQDNHLRAGNRDIPFKGHVKNHGVCIDATLSTMKHIDHISRSAYVEIGRISSIRNLLTTKAIAQLMYSFVLSRLNYCNSLLTNINCDQMYTLQKVQNQAAEVVFRKSRHEHVRPFFKALHRLPVKDRIIFKMATFVFRFFDGTLPPYLPSCLSVYTPSRTPRSSSNGGKLFLVQDGNLRALVTPCSLFRLLFVRNKLPAHIRHRSSFPQFKTSLKTLSLYFCLL